MKYLSIIFYICFGLLAHSQASADDVKDFQIEEVGIGESLLGHYTENEILKNKQENQFPKSNNFIVTTFYKILLRFISLFLLRIKMIIDI